MNETDPAWVNPWMEQRQEVPLSRTAISLLLTPTLVALCGCASTTGLADQPISVGAAAAISSDGAPDPHAATTTTDSPKGEISREPWSFASYSGQAITTPHYRIFTTVQHENVVDELPLFLEHALTRYRTALADLPAPKRPMETYLFADRRQWTAKTKQVLPNDAAAFENLGRGGFTTRGIAVLYFIDRSRRTKDTFAIAAHEGWHQYTQCAFGNPLPIWLEEGIATYMESCRIINGEPQFQPSRNWERRRTLADAIREERLIPMKQLLEEAPQAFLKSSRKQLLTYYAQVWALTRFLSEGADGRYREGLEQALSDAAAGDLLRRLMSSPAVKAQAKNDRSRLGLLRSRSGPWVIVEYFNDDLAEFESEFQEFAQELAQGGPYRTWQEHGRRRAAD